MAKIALKKLLKDDEIISHVFFNALGKNSKAIESWKDDKANLPEYYDITLTVNKTKLNVEKFFEVLYDQYIEMVKKAATSIVKEQTSKKLNELIGKISDAKEAIDNAINDINWGLEGKELIK